MLYDPPSAAVWYKAVLNAENLLGMHANPLLLLSFRKLNLSWKVCLFTFPPSSPQNVCPLLSQALFMHL